MIIYNIILNKTRKEFWVAEPKYTNRIAEIVAALETKYEVSYYPTSQEQLEADVVIENQRGYKKADHYLDWDL